MEIVPKFSILLLMSKQIVSPFSYLPLYNLLSAFGWAYILYAVISIYPKIGQPVFFEQTKQAIIIIQSCAAIEIFNSALGIVRSPLTTTVAQVTSRLVVVLGIFSLLPETPAARSYAYISLLLAWSITEVIRYLFYFYSLSAKEGPSKLLVLLRYNLFWLLYPIGVGSELYIIFSALPIAASKYSEQYRYFLIVCMFLYIPGFPTLFLHMVTQRAKVMKNLRAGPAQKKD